MLIALAALALLAPQSTTDAHAPLIRIPGTARIRVVQGSEKSPVAHAEVRSCISPEYVGIFWMDDSYDRLWPALERASLAGTTDEHGEIDVPVGGNCTLIAASQGSCWGVTRVLPDFAQAAEQAQELQLWPDFDLRVRVVDAHDQPLPNVPVACRLSTGGLGWRLRVDPIVQSTDTQGVALLQHAGFEMNQSQEVHSRHYVAIASCLEPAVEVRVDPVHPPADPILLRMPPTGEVELVYEEQDGSPIPMQGLCAVAIPACFAEPPQISPFPLLRLHEAGLECVQRAGTSSVVFRRISLDTDLDLWAQRNAISVAACLRLRGPHVAGERVRAVLHPPDVALLLGQLVDETGTARHDVGFSVQTRWAPPPGGWPRPVSDDGVVRFTGSEGDDDDRERDLGSLLVPSWGPTIQTDDQGRFRIDFDAAPYDIGRLFLLFVEKRGEPGERSARIRLEPRATRGVVDLGKFVLPASPLIAAGIIRDEDGHPLAGVLVQGSSARSGGYRFTTTSQADGSFCLRGSYLETYIDVRFTHSRHVDANPLGVIETGSKDLAIVMRKAEPPHGGVQGK